MTEVLELLRCVLWRHKYSGTLSAIDFMQVMSIADKQTVLGLVFEALKDRRLEGITDKKPIFEGMSKAEKIKRQNHLLNKDLVGFVNKCDQLEIGYLVVKGQTIGCLYPKPELRQPGDIDFLFPVESDYETQRAKMAQIFPKTQLPEKMLEGEVGFKHNGIIYELHTSLRGWAKKKHQKIWDDLMEQEWKELHYVEIGGVKVRTLSPTMNAAYVFIHLFFHFIREGVSLRQMCDWAIVLFHYEKEIDRERLMKILIDLDMLDAYRAFGVLLVDDIGLESQLFPFQLGEEDRVWRKFIIGDIIRGGNFGMLHHKSSGSWKYKMETMRIAIRNSFKYYKLCPSEVGGMIPRLVKGNLRLLFS